MKRKKSIAILGGSFDPIHIGHINLAIEALAQHPFLESIFFIPAYTSPFKQTKPPCASPKDRLNMVKIAIKPIGKKAVVWTKELTEKKISYTIETIQQMKEEFPNLYFIISEEVACTFHHWKEFDTILTLAKPLVASSNPMPFMPAKDMPKKCKEILEEGRFFIPHLDISSTRLRALLKKEFYSPLVPPKVLDYIHKHHLYLSC